MIQTIEKIKYFLHKQQPKIYSMVVSFYSITTDKFRFTISKKQKIILFESLFNLVQAGIPLPQAITIIFFQTKNKKIKFLLESIRKDINKGVSLYESFGKFYNVCTPFDTHMIQMGELTGNIAHAFQIIAKRTEENAELQSKILGALTYPSIIILLSLGMITGFLTFIVPRIQEMYIDARVNLPPLTQTVIHLSEYFQKHGYMIGIIFVCTLFLFFILSKYQTTKYYLDKYILKIPLFGNILKKKILIIFSYTLGNLLESGISIYQALTVTKNSIENAYYKKRIEYIGEKISEGIPLSELMGIKNLVYEKEDPYFPLEFASIVKIGEKTGKLASLLLKIGGKYEREINGIIKNLSTILEPLVIIVVGGIIGVMLLAVLLPFFNMVKVLG